MQAYHETATIDTPIAPEWAGQSEPTPLELLDGPTLDQAEAWVYEPTPRYVVEPKHSRTLDRVLFHIIDRMDGSLVRWAFSRADAEGQAEDLNAEDYEPLLIGTLPWFEAAAPCEHFDTPIRLAPQPVTRTLAKFEDAYPSF